MPVISTKFALDGEKAYKAAISEINSGLKVLKSEMNLVSETYKGNEKSMDALVAKSDVLERQYLSQAEKVEYLREQLERAAKQYGEADKRTQNYRVSLNNAKAELTKFERELNEASDAIEHYGEAQDEAQEKTAGLGDVIQSLADKAGVKLPEGLTKAANGMGSMNVAAIGVAAGIGAAIAVIVKIEKALIDMTKEAAEAAKQLELLSSSTNLSIESAQEWDYVLQNVGSSLEEAQGDLSALQEKMMEAAKGEGEAAELFSQLGINVMDTSGKLKDTDTVMRELVSAMQMMDDETQRNAISSALLGGTGEKLTALYDMEAGAVDELIDKKRELGVASEAEVKELAKVSEAMMDLEATTEAAKTKISADFAPGFVSALENIQDMIGDVSNFLHDTGIVTAFGGLFDAATNVIAALTGTTLDGVKNQWSGLALILATIADSANVVAALMRRDWDGVKTALGFNMDKGQLSTIQRILYADGLETSSYNEALGGWSGNATVNANDYVEEMRWIDPSAEPVISTDDWTKLKGVYIGNSTGTDNWRGGWTWVGENGPELMRLPQGSQVMNSQESRDYGGDTYNITIDAKSVKEFEDIVRIVQNQRRLRRMEG